MPFAKMIALEHHRVTWLPGESADTGGVCVPVLPWKPMKSALLDFHDGGLWAKARRPFTQHALASFIYTEGIRFHTTLDEAAATSTYTAGEESPNESIYSARHSLSPGSGYWASSGHHEPDEIVAWTGLLHRRRAVSGIKISWAYAPGEVRIRTTADGLHWDEVVPWHHPAEKSVSFEEDLTFDRPRNVMQVKVEMREPRAWSYFGINQATLVL